MKLLIGHMASTTALPRMIQAARWQSIFGWPAGVDRILVTDKAENQQHQIQTIVEPAGEEKGLFNLSKMRNRLLDHAILCNYDGLVILEADFVILKWCSAFPETWAVPYAVYDQPDKISFTDLPLHGEFNHTGVKDWMNLGWRGMLPVHCLFLNKSVFDKARWDERYEGIGYDDWDYNSQLWNAVGPYEHTDALLCHRYHPSMMGSPRPENKALYESKWGKIQG